MSTIDYKTLPHSAKGGAKASKSNNKSLLGLQAFFKKIIDSSVENCPVLIRQIEKKLRTTRRCRPVVKISKIVEDLNGSSKVPLIVAKVLDDETILQFQPINIIALSWSKSVQKKIEANGGSISTLDQFIKVAGSLDNIMPIIGDLNKRKSAKYWGLAPGEKGSTAYPRDNHKAKNCEKRLNVKKQIKFEELSD
ncbi:60S ribosomal protein L18 [Glugoides intestinalis]